MEAQLPNDNVHDFSKGYLALPFDNEQFHDFVIGLLGKPQTIEKVIHGTFEIHLNDLQNVYELINQRVTQQNRGKLIQLKTQISYSDNSSVLLSSYHELLTYREVKPVVSNGIRMTWVYLIQFEDKKVPERQEVEIFINASSYSSFYDESVLLLPRKFHTILSGGIAISIRHTARSWGTDIESLLTHHFQSKLKKENIFIKFINDNNGTIGFLAGLLSFLAGTIGLYYLAKDFYGNDLNKVTTFINHPGLQINEKLDFLIKYIAQGSQGYNELKIMAFELISLIVSIIIGMVIADFASNEEYSYIILTEQSLKEKEKKEKKRERRVLSFFLSIIGGLGLDLLAHYIFRYLTGG